MGVPRRDRAGARYPDAMDCGEVNRLCANDLELAVDHAILEEEHTAGAGLKLRDSEDTAIDLHDRVVVGILVDVQIVGVRSAVPLLHRVHVLVKLKANYCFPDLLPTFPKLIVFHVPNLVAKGHGRGVVQFVVDFISLLWHLGSGPPVARTGQHQHGAQNIQRT
eukprot:1213618-Rhodomonas_salina.1